MIKPAQQFHRVDAINAFIRGAVLSALACAASGPAAADEAATGATSEAEPEIALAEVVVSARRREESLQDVPLSVLAVDGDALRQGNIQRLEDLTSQLPNVHVGESGVLDNVFIRGIGSGTNQGFEQSVGTFQDGLYYGRSRSSRGPFLDVSRVEVMRGPQSILFGKNTIAGAINITSAAPTRDLDGYVTSFYEVEAGEWSGTGVLSGGLTETLSGRVAVRASGMDGWVDNVARDRDEPSTEERAARLSFLWDGGAGTTIGLKLEANQFDTVGRASELSLCSAQLSALLAVNDPREDCTFNGRKTSGGTGQWGNERSDSDSQSAGLTIEHRFERALLTAITGYVAYNYIDLSDPDQTTLSALLLDVREDFTQWSQEVRLASVDTGPIDYIAGVYWQTADLESRFDTNINPGVVGLPVPAGNRANDFDQTADTYAAFAHVGYSFADIWKVTGGVRYTHEEKDAHKKQVIASAFTRTPNPALYGFFAGALQSVPHDFTASMSESNWSPLLSLEVRPRAGTLFYASASRGFKGGGFDALLPNGNQNQFAFKPEEVTAYELGMKSTWADGRARLNVAVFRSEFEDLQVSTFVPPATFAVTNAAGAVSQGVEVDAAWKVLEPLRIDANIAYLDSTYTDFANAACYVGQTVATGCAPNAQNALVQDLSGRPTQFAPSWSGQVAATWQKDIGSLRYRIRGDIEFSDSFYAANDLDPNTRQGSYAKYGAQLALGSVDERWELALVGKNLTDELTTHWSNDVPLFNGSYFKFADRTREIALQGTWKF